MTAMLNWYRAAAWYRPQPTDSRRMARPSLDYCDEGNLIFFPTATHWVQHEEPEEVNRRLWEFVLT